jgi:hypothetical protein
MRNMNLITYSPHISIRRIESLCDHWKDIFCRYKILSVRRWHHLWVTEWRLIEREFGGSALQIGMDLWSGVSRHWAWVLPTAMKHETKNLNIFLFCLGFVHWAHYAEVVDGCVTSFISEQKMWAGKPWTIVAITINYLVSFFGVQRESPRSD